VLRRFRKIWLWILCIGFVLFLISSNSGQTSNWHPAEKLVIELTAPFQKLITETFNLTKQFWHNYFYLVNLRQENQELRRRIDALRLQNSRYRERLATHQRLQELLHFEESLQHPTMAAQVIGLDPTGWFRSVIIDKGKNDGLQINMPVVNASGVVGKIVSISDDYAKVLLIIDQNSAVDALVQRSRDRGMARGFSRQLCALDYVLKSSDVRVGDSVVTSGLGGIFPKGLPVGRISRVEDPPGSLFKEIELRPTVEFSKLEEVLIILEVRGHPKFGQKNNQL
jgi:rod shape-determining protein MreC